MSIQCVRRSPWTPGAVASGPGQLLEDLPQAGGRSPSFDRDGRHTRFGGSAEFKRSSSTSASEVNLGTSQDYAFPGSNRLKLPERPIGIPGNHDQGGGFNYPCGLSSVFRNSALSKAMPYVEPALPLPALSDPPRWRSRRGDRVSQPLEHSDVGYKLSGVGK